MGEPNAEIIEGIFSSEKVAARRERSFQEMETPNPYPAPEFITLGDKQFEIRPLKLRFLRELESQTAKWIVLSKTATEEEKTQAWYDRQVAKVTTAIIAADPKLAEQGFDLNDLEMTYPQLTAAGRAIDRICGLQPAGEAQGSESTGGTSTAS